MPRTPTLFLMVGLPGAGKTTLARQLEAERSALRLTPDDWITPLYGANLSQAKLDAVRDPVEAVQWAVAERALKVGVDVVLDFGTWSKREREDFRARAKALGARSEVRYLDVPRSVLSERVAARNAALPPNAFHVSEAQLDQWSRLFEPPDADELRPREAPGQES